jgi:1-deoxy-D-xylulose-5-phosphate reductoisomerase
MPDSHPIRVVVLGSTGSVGTQALEVVRAMPGAFRVVGLAGNSRWEALVGQVEEFRPDVVNVADAESAEALRAALSGSDVEVTCGADGLCRLAASDAADVVLSAVSGGAGLPAAIAALEAGKTLALANKEPVVMCGHILMDLARTGPGRIVPVDSEHSAAFQLMQGVRREDVKRLVLTASGGPFRGRSAQELAAVTPKEALAHPTWRMGPKITIDSATLMNKALEVIEARWLFDLPAEKLGVVVHPQSVVHAMLELTDGSMLAHMGAPDMRLPIQYALCYPERAAGVATELNLTALGGLEFHEPDTEACPALELGFRVARQGGTSGAVLSAANEVAVAAFLAGEIAFTEIVALVERVLGLHDCKESPDLAAVLAADEWAREECRRCLK